MLLLFPLVAFSLHKEYYSLTKIDFNQKEKSVQVTMRLFANDLELALNKQYDKSVELGTKLEIAEADTFIELYLNQKFALTINGKDSPYVFLGKEFEKDVVYLYMEINNIPTIEQMSIRNSVLTEQFHEQENIVKVNANKQRKTFVLTKRNDKGMLKF